MIIVLNVIVWLMTFWIVISLEHTILYILLSQSHFLYAVPGRGLYETDDIII